MKPILHLTGTMSIEALIVILNDIESFCGEDSQVTLEHCHIKLDVEHFAADEQEVDATLNTMLGALEKYPVQAKIS